MSKFKPCQNCNSGADSVVIEVVSTYRYSRDNIYTVGCTECGEFEVFKAAMYLDGAAITNKALKKWNRYMSRLP